VPEASKPCVFCAIINGEAKPEIIIEESEHLIASSTTGRCSVGTRCSCRSSTSSC